MRPNPHRVIFVNRFFYPDHSATRKNLSDLAFTLSAHGFKVVTSRLRYDTPITCCALAYACS